MKIARLSKKFVTSTSAILTLAILALLTTSCASSRKVHWGSRTGNTSKGGATELTKPISQ